MDDIVIYASFLAEHSQKLRKLLGRLKSAGLSLQPDKCLFLKKEITYLGHLITENGVKPNPKKTVAVKNFPVPKTKKNVKQFLGLVGYYRRFIENFSQIAKPLTLLLKNETTFIWLSLHQKAFETLGDQICTHSILQYPDFSKPFLVTTDASHYAIGGVLSQGEIGTDLPIAYTSRTLQNAEINYSTIEKGLLAIVYCVKQFRPYLCGREFILITDHRPLVWLNGLKDPISRLSRWRIKLSEYNYKIAYKPGKINLNAAALSRNPIMKEKICAIENLKLDPDYLVENVFGFLERNSLLRINDKLNDYKGYLCPNDLQPGNVSLLPGLGTGDVIPRDEDYRNSESSVLKVTSIAVEETNPLHDTKILGQGDNPQENNLNRKHCCVLKIENACLLHSNDRVSMGQGHIVHFLSTDCVFESDVSKKLIENNLIQPELFKKDEFSIGQVVVFTQNNRYIFHVIVKNKFEDKTYLNILSKAILALRKAMEPLNVPVVRISNKGNGIDEISWLSIEKIFYQHFFDSEFKIKICSGETKLPDLNDRNKIIKELHESTVGGHKGISKTYTRIRAIYY